MAPSSIPYQSSEDAAAQDTFDANLNQTIFIIAFVVAGIIQLGAVTYLGFWIVRRCRTSRKAAATDTGPEGKYLPRQLMLPSRVASSTGGLKKLNLSSFSIPRLDKSQRASDVEDTVPLRSLRSPEQQWHQFDRVSSNAAPFMPFVGARVSVTPSKAPRLSVAFTPPLEMDLGSPDSDAMSFSSASTIVEVIEPTIGFAPRIVVEDFAPGPHPFFEDSSDSDTDSDMSIDDEKIDNQLLVVPPMSWNAPRDLVESKHETYSLEWESQTPVKTVKKSKSLVRMFSVLTDITNVAKPRPKLPRVPPSTVGQKSRPSHKDAAYPRDDTKENITVWIP